MAFYNDLNNLGKRYEAESRFRLLLTIIKDDAKARILKLMTKEQVIGFKTFNEAVEAQNAFHVDADYVLDSNFSKEDFASYGLSCIIDEAGRLHSLHKAFWSSQPQAGMTPPLYTEEVGDEQSYSDRR